MNTKAPWIEPHPLHCPAKGVRFTASFRSAWLSELWVSGEVFGRRREATGGAGPAAWCSVDPDAGEVLIRSTPPSQLASGTQYFEVILSSKASGAFSLKRYRSVKGQPGRDPVEITVTHEVLLKLTDDLIATIPAGTP